MVLNSFIFTSFFISFLFISYSHSTASVLASAGFAKISSAVQVTISSVTFSEFSTGAKKVITSLWTGNNCATTAYDEFNQYKTSKSSCLFSATSAYPPLILQSNTAVCQGFVTAVDYLVTHSTTGYGIISSVTAAVTVTDVPLFFGSPKVALFENNYDGFSPGNFAGYSGEIPSVSVSQSFSATFMSADSAGASQLNGNIVER